MYIGYVLIGLLNFVYQLLYYIWKVGMVSYVYFIVCKIVYDRWFVWWEKIVGNSRFGKFFIVKIFC